MTCRLAFLGYTHDTVMKNFVQGRKLSHRTKFGFHNLSALAKKRSRCEDNLLHMSILEMSDLTNIKMETECQGSDFPGEVYLNLMKKCEMVCPPYISIYVVLFP